MTRHEVRRTTQNKLTLNLPSPTDNSFAGDSQTTVPAAKNAQAIRCHWHTVNIYLNTLSIYSNTVRQLP